MKEALALVLGVLCCGSVSCNLETEKANSANSVTESRSNSDITIKDVREQVGDWDTSTPGAIDKTRHLLGRIDADGNGYDSSGVTASAYQCIFQDAYVRQLGHREDICIYAENA